MNKGKNSGPPVGKEFYMPHKAVLKGSAKSTKPVTAEHFVSAVSRALSKHQERISNIQLHCFGDASERGILKQCMPRHRCFVLNQGKRELHAV